MPRAPVKNSWRARSAAALALVAALHVAAPSAPAGLRAEVEAAIRSVDLRGASYAISIRDPLTGEQVVGHNASDPMIPASNMKLLTSGAALHVLGPRFEFVTRLLRDGDGLVVVGDGDPAFGDPALLAEMHHDGAAGIDVETFLGFWVGSVVDSGMTRVSEVVVDDRIFDREFVHPSWPDEQLNRDYCAQVSGLVFHENVLYFYPEPSGGGKPLVSNFVPHASWISPAINATCKTGKNSRNSVWISRQLGTNKLTVYGNVRHRHRAPIDVTVHDMPEFFAHLLADRLQGAGVEVDGWRVAGADDPIGVGTTVGPIITTPIATVLRRCNSESRNLYAESLLKRIGHEMTGRPGSWRNGTAIVRHVVYERLRDPTITAPLMVTDGSGLSRDNRVTAALLSAWLASFATDEQLAPVFLESLAEPGETGTLRKRFADVDLHGADVQAKSGYISQVSCLSGYVTMPDGRRRAFSVLVNGLSGSTAPAKRLQERVVTAIAADLATPVPSLGSD